GELPYLLTLGPHAFYWFALEPEVREARSARPSLAVPGRWDQVLRRPALGALERVLPAFLAGQRWFGHDASDVASASVTEVVPVDAAASRRSAPRVVLAMVRVELVTGGTEDYTLPLGFATGTGREELSRWRPDSVVADLRAGGAEGGLYDAAQSPDFCRAMYRLIVRRRSLLGRSGRLVGVPALRTRRLAERIGADPAAVPMSVEQSNTSVTLGDKAGVLKLVRRVEEGVNPAVEMGRFLSERTQFANVPLAGGSVEYRPARRGADATTVAALEEYVASEGDGWSVVVDTLSRGLEEALAHPGAEELRHVPPARLVDVDVAALEPGHLLVGPHIEWASLLGRRVGELHLALASDPANPAFAPEPLTFGDRQSLYHGARALTRRVFRQIAAIEAPSPSVQAVMGREHDIVERLRVVRKGGADGLRIRCHGDLHLGQVLWTGKDFVVIDFEGEPVRSLSQRRLKRPAALDLAGMIRSFHYAAQAAAMGLARDLPASADPAALEAWLALWYRWVSAIFLDGYRRVAGAGGFLPPDPDRLGDLLDFFLLEKAVYELGYEASRRPEWMEIPALGLLELLDAGR
ncbi:MAG TPA: putative maltokinase, partial [Acidimicrobiales bacterium]|nr:putative maltokinase [Acidimicrobiales bacterium]